MASYEKTNHKKLVKQGGLNAKSGLILFLINTITAFILNPILVTYFGAYYFGIWKSIDKFLGFAGIADGKGAQALKWTIANHESKEDESKKQRFVGASLIVWFIFLPILMTIIGAIAYFSPTLIANVHPEDKGLVLIIIILLGINLIIMPLFSISESVLIGTNQGYFVNYIRMTWLILAFVITYVVVFLEFGLKELAMSIVLITVLRGISFLITAKKEVPWFGALKPTRVELKSFFKFSSWTLVWSFIARFLLGSEVIFLSILINPTAVSQYTFTSYLVITGISVAAIVSSSFNPVIGRLFGNKEYESCQHIVANLREFILAFSVFIGTVVLLLNQSFVSLWAGETLFLGSWNNLFIVLLMIELLLVRNEAFIIDISLNIKVKVLLGLGSVVLSSLFAVVGYYIIDNSISMIFMGVFLGRVPLLFFFPMMVNRMMKNKQKFGFSWKLFGYAFIILASSYLIGTEQSFSSWWTLMFLGALETILVMGFVYTLLLSSENQAFIREKFLSRIKRSKK